VLIITILNTLTLTINWYEQNIKVDDTLDYINYSFAFVFVFEAFAKIVAFGPYLFFRDLGNCFDFFIVCSSITSTVVSLLLGIDFGSSMTFIRAFRIAKIFKYIKGSQQIKIIFETLVVTIPALTNIGGLLLLFLYIYSVLGVFLFAEIKL
jgi:Ion transport protein